MESITAIDQNNLDKEWEMQPRRVEEVATKLAKAKLRLSESKTAVEVAEAEASNDIRKQPDAYLPDGKVTEASVKSQICLHPKVTAAIAKQQKLQYKVDLLQAVMTALEHKKRALEDLVQLFSINYFGTPKASQSTQERAKEELRKKKRRSNYKP